MAVMKKYSIFSLARNALSHHENWWQAWHSPEPKKRYDAVISGGGGHGLATAYYLAKEHGLTDIAVLEKGWLGGGNTGRNTTIIRSNYLWTASAGIYEKGLQLWEHIGSEVNFNMMFSQRGVLNLGHNLQDMRTIERRVNANRLNGVDGQVLNAQQVKELVPIIDTSENNTRFPVLGSSFQPRGGIARHDALAWGMARACDDLGIDVIQQCEVTGIRRDNGQVVGVDTSRGPIETNRVGAVTAGNSGVIADMAGIRLPVQSRPLQALVSEPIKPVIDTVVMSGAVHVYISQSDKGELVIGAGVDKYNGYGHQGSIAIVEEQLAALVELYPIVSRLRLLRHWAGCVDVCPDASPLVTKTPVQGLYFNCGWGTGGWKATLGSGWCFAHTMAQDEPHPLNAAYSLKRFETGAVIDEHGAAGVAH
jgi:sarcosine oxidase subunit beta